MFPPKKNITRWAFGKPEGCWTKTTWMKNNSVCEKKIPNNVPSSTTFSEIDTLFLPAECVQPKPIQLIYYENTFWYFNSFTKMCKDKCNLAWDMQSVFVVSPQT